MKNVLALLLLPALASAEPPPRVNACLERPLEIGAAITARLPEASAFDMFGFGLYNHVVRLVQASADGTLTDEILRKLKLDPNQRPSPIGGRRIEGSPSSKFLEHYGSNSLLAFLRDPISLQKRRMNRVNLASNVGSAPEAQVPSLSWNGLETVPESLEALYKSAMGYNRDSDGAWQIHELLAGRNRKIFDNASVIFGVDLLYWDTANGDCDRTHAAETAALRLIDAAAQTKKVLFIGTVPLEDGSKVPINSRLTGIPNVWYENKHVCAENVNAAIRATCQVSNGCYIVDLAGMAAALNDDQALFVKAQNRAFYRRQMRPDGVHVSSVGAQYVMEQMVRDFEANPPAVCR